MNINNLPEPLINISELKAGEFKEVARTKQSIVNNKITKSVKFSSLKIPTTGGFKNWLLKLFRREPAVRDFAKTPLTPKEVALISKIGSLNGRLSAMSKELDALKDAELKSFYAPDNLHELDTQSQDEMRKLIKNWKKINANLGKLEKSLKKTHIATKDNLHADLTGSKVALNRKINDLKYFIHPSFAREQFNSLEKIFRANEMKVGLASLLPSQKAPTVKSYQDLESKLDEMQRFLTRLESPSEEDNALADDVSNLLLAVQAKIPAEPPAAPEDDVIHVNVNFEAGVLEDDIHAQEIERISTTMQNPEAEDIFGGKDVTRNTIVLQGKKMPDPVDSGDPKERQARCGEIATALNISAEQMAMIGKVIGQELQGSFFQEFTQRFQEEGCVAGLPPVEEGNPDPTSITFQRTGDKITITQSNVFVARHSDDDLVKGYVAARTIIEIPADSIPESCDDLRATGFAKNMTLTQLYTTFHPRNLKKIDASLSNGTIRRAYQELDRVYIPQAKRQ